MLQSPAIIDENMSDELKTILASTPLPTTDGQNPCSLADNSIDTWEKKVWCAGSLNFLHKRLAICESTL
jgi:hypothetical protein